MIKLNDYHPLNATESDATKWRGRDYRSEDPMIKYLESIGWEQRSDSHSKYFRLISVTKNYHNRFHLMIKPLKRRHKGHSYRVRIEFVPYCNEDYRFNGYINTEEEIRDIIGEISENLILKK